MSKSKFTVIQIAVILAEGESGLPVAEVCRQHGISNATYYQWKSKYSGVFACELERTGWPTGGAVYFS
jgi:putative transposase